MKTQWETYKKLELIPDAMWEAALQDAALRKLPQLHLQPWFKKVWQFIGDIFVKDAEPKIWQKCDRDGNLCWYVYDPVTGSSGCFSSRAEVLSWLESRYYHRGLL